MTRYVLTAVVALLLASSAVKHPHLELRHSPIFPMGSPAEVLFVAEIKGGMTELWYCPEITWEFTDLSRSTSQEDCAPWEVTTDIPRRWTQAVLMGQGFHTATVTLRQHGKLLARQTAELEVR